MILTHLYVEDRAVAYRTPLRSPFTREADDRRSGSTALTIAIEIVQRRSRWVWVRSDVEPEPIPAGFEVIRRRWVVERTFAWISGNRRMSRDYEFLAKPQKLSST
jgi:transposase